MNLVDSCGWLEYFSDSSNAAFFAPAIEDIRELLVPSICILEVFKRTLQQKGEEPALRAVVQMRLGKVVDLTTPIALESARLSVETKLSIADSIILATAQLYRAEIWTQDADFEGLPNVKFRAKK